MEELDAVQVISAERVPIRERSESREGVCEGDTARQETAEACEAEEADPCILGTCACKVTYVKTGKPVPRDAFAMTIRDRYL